LATDETAQAVALPSTRHERDHILSCDKCALSERFAKHEKVSKTLIAILRSVGLFPWAGAGGGGPRLRDPRAFSRGSGERNRRMDGRWGSNADGSCTYDHERAAEYARSCVRSTRSSLRVLRDCLTGAFCEHLLVSHLLACDSNRLEDVIRAANTSPLSLLSL
jgi:hypothetical protein